MKLAIKRLLISTVFRQERSWNTQYEIPQIQMSRKNFNSILTNWVKPAYPFTIRSPK